MKHLENAFAGKRQVSGYFIVLAIVWIVILLCTIGCFFVLEYWYPEISDILDGDNYNALYWYVDKNVMLLVWLVPFAVSLLAFALIIKPIQGRSIVEVINGRRQLRWSRLWWGFLIWGILILGADIYSYVSYPEDFTLIFNIYKFIPLLIISFLFFPLQVALEEVVFRGYLMQAVGMLTGYRWVALLVSSFLFACLHMDNPEILKYGQIMFFQYLLAGLIWGLIAVLDDGIELAIGMHAANNIFISLFATEKGTVFETDAIFEVGKGDPVTGLLITLLCGSIAVAICYKKYNWNFGTLFKKVEKPEDATQPIG